MIVHTLDLLINLKQTQGYLSQVITEMEVYNKFKDNQCQLNSTKIK